MRLRRKIAKPRKLEEKRKDPFFSNPGSEEKTPFFPFTNSLMRKLNVGKSNDPQEKEADSVAKQLSRLQINRAEKQEEEKPVQKQEKKEEEKPVQKDEKKEEEKPVQKEEKKEEEKPIQRAEKKEEDMPVQKAVEESEKIGPGGRGTPAFESILARRRGMGSELPEDIRRQMEEKMNASFKDVRIHTDAEAEELCEQVHALAFTNGKDIYFNKGQYKPDSDSGKELLAHELTHVVQQRG
jgi:hypothetical protein